MIDRSRESGAPNGPHDRVAVPQQLNVELVGLRDGLAVDEDLRHGRVHQLDDARHGRDLERGAHDDEQVARAHLGLERAVRGQRGPGGASQREGGKGKRAATRVRIDAVEEVLWELLAEEDDVWLHQRVAVLAGGRRVGQHQRPEPRLRKPRENAHE